MIDWPKAPPLLIAVIGECLVELRGGGPPAFADEQALFGDGAPAAVGNRMSSALLREEMGLTGGRVFKTWRFLVRWLAPVGVGSVLIFGLAA